MRTLGKTVIIFLPLLVIVVPFSCEDRFAETYDANVPVYMSYEDLRKSVNLNSVRNLENPGEIYFYNNLLFVVEDKKGVHIMNNHDAPAPVNIGFINIPGNVDIAIKNDMLYADSYVDLVVIDISEINNPHEVGRVKNVFPYVLPQYNSDYLVEEIDQGRGVVIDWEVKKVTSDVKNYTPPYPVYPVHKLDGGEVDYLSGGINNVSGNGNPGSFGVGSSMARFIIKENVLYVLGNNQLKVFNIAIGSSPTESGYIRLMDPAEIRFPSINTVGIVPYNKILMKKGKNGVYQYTYSNFSEVKLLNTIAAGDN